MTQQPYLLGLTGSIGMGKSTTAAMFAAAGVPVWDADAVVHRLYGPGEAGAAAVAALSPDAVKDGAVDRQHLRAAILADPGLLGRIEAAVHPLVAANRAVFLAENHAAPLVVFDIPLLFETGAEAGLDGVLVVTAPEAVQRARVLARFGMTEGAFERIVSRQMPDVEKRRRADFMIDTTAGRDAARAAVLDLIAKLTLEARHA